MQRLWELDPDKSGGVSFEEFKAGRIFKKLPPEAAGRIVSNGWTPNQDGVISPKDKPEPPFKRDGGEPAPETPGWPASPDGKPGHGSTARSSANSTRMAMARFRLRNSARVRR